MFYRNILRKKPNDTFLISLIVLFIVIAPLVIYIYKIRYGSYVLDYDEAPLIVHTIESAPLGWFSEGLSKYFYVYPEWSQPRSNFVRPVFQLYTYIINRLFGDNYAMYYLLYFITQFIIVIAGVAFWRSVGVGARLRTFATLLLALSPAFISICLVSFAFAGDNLAALLCLIAFLFIIHQRYIFGFLVITTAVFTKEIALYAPIAAAATVLFLDERSPRRWATSGLFLSPLAMWAALRWHAFGSVMGGTTGMGASVALGPNSFAIGVVYWPIGHIVGHQLAAALRGDFSQPHLAAALIFLCLNLTVWAFLAICYVSAMREYWAKRGSRLSFEDRAYFSALLWLGGALAYLVTTGMSEARYGSSAYFFLITVVVLTFARHKSAVLKTGALSALATITLVFIAKDYISLSYDIPTLTANIKYTKALGDALRLLPESGTPVLIVNAPYTYSAPSYIARSLNIHRSLVFVNQLTLDPGCVGLNEFHTSMTRNYDTSIISVAIPLCANIKFVNTGDTFDDLRRSDNKIVRPGVGAYYFPDAHVTRFSLFGQKPTYDLGHRLIFSFADPSVDVLAFDGATGNYALLQADSAGSPGSP